MKSKSLLICYNLGKLNQSDKVEFRRALVGYTSHSNNSRYRYKKSGLLNRIPTFNPIKGVLIIELKNKHKLIKILNKYKVTYFLFNTIIENSKLATK